jgi:hypothetical protein
MTWIKGDTLPHIDSGQGHFENTYLIYLTGDEQGKLVIANNEYPIDINTGFIFNEGLEHKTINTIEPRLLIGPMNENAMTVGAALFYYLNQTDAENSANLIGFGDYILKTNLIYNLGFEGTFEATTLWRVGYYVDSVFTVLPDSYPNNTDLSVLGLAGSYYVGPNAPCFLEGTEILCLIDNEEKYIKIENLKNNVLVKTSKNGYKKIEVIGNGIIYNPNNDLRIENRLYKYSKNDFPELTKDLYLSGGHSILVDKLTPSQKNQMTKTYMTEGRFRLPAYIDERAVPMEGEGKYAIWHFALENTDKYMNYGIYSNGLLTETCSINFMKNYSNLNIS